jgi:hypothetical protein
METLFGFGGGKSCFEGGSWKVTSGCEAARGARTVAVQLSPPLRKGIGNTYHPYHISQALRRESNNGGFCSK